MEHLVKEIDSLLGERGGEVGERDIFNAENYIYPTLMKCKKNISGKFSRELCFADIVTEF